MENAECRHGHRQTLTFAAEFILVAMDRLSEMLRVSMCPLDRRSVKYRLDIGLSIRKGDSPRLEKCRLRKSIARVRVREVTMMIRWLSMIRTMDGRDGFTREDFTEYAKFE